MVSRVTIDYSSSAMETSLHQTLKKHYGGQDDQFEVTVGNYRIDVISQGRLVEIQLAPLAAIRNKVHALLKDHQVLVVKPIIVQKTIVKRVKRHGPVISRRRSPKQGRIIDLFHEMVHFTNVFPHKRLTLEVPLIDIEEWRYPGHGHRRRWHQKDYRVEDQKLIAVHQMLRFQTAADLAQLITVPLPSDFHTGHLAESLHIPRWISQRIAYCLRRMNALREVGKQGNARLYEFAVDCKAA
jgi:hypothetical protein